VIAKRLQIEEKAAKIIVDVDRDWPIDTEFIIGIERPQDTAKALLLDPRDAQKVLHRKELQQTSVINENRENYQSETYKCGLQRGMLDYLPHGASPS
jgi:hypothetical protein